MIATLAIIFPLFALILAGWLARRSGIMSSDATREINRFVIYLAMPALLFHVVATSSWQNLWQPGFLAVFTLSTSAVFLITLLLYNKIVGASADSPVIGLTTAYPNTAYLGFPLLLAALGPDSSTLSLIATLVVACGLFAVAIIMIEVRLHAGGSIGQVCRNVLQSLLKNPLILAPLLGSLFPTLGVSIPASVESFLKMLGSCASPCALVALGMFLAQSQMAAANQTCDATPLTRSKDTGLIAMLVAIKLIVHPILAWSLATWVFPLSGTVRSAAILLAVMPTGTGPFMLAEFYRRDAQITARVILISTLISILTITACLSLIA